MVPGGAERFVIVNYFIYSPRYLFTAEAQRRREEEQENEENAEGAEVTEIAPGVKVNSPSPATEMCVDTPRREFSNLRELTINASSTYNRNVR